jgi:hypothetical protein
MVEERNHKVIFHPVAGSKMLNTITLNGTGDRPA